VRGDYYKEIQDNI